jgi:hypothetical protein
MTPTPSALNFAPVPARSTGAVESIKVTNSGSGGLQIAMAQVAGPNAQDFAKVGDSCSGASVSAGGNCTVSLRFAPKTVGIKSAALQITDDAAGSPQLVTLNGTALIKYPRSETTAPGLPASFPSIRGVPPPVPHRPGGPRPSVASPGSLAGMISLPPIGFGTLIQPAWRLIEPAVLRLFWFLLF